MNRYYLHIFKYNIAYVTQTIYIISHMGKLCPKIEEVDAEEEDG